MFLVLKLQNQSEIQEKLAMYHKGEVFLFSFKHRTGHLYTHRPYPVSLRSFALVIMMTNYTGSQTVKSFSSTLTHRTNFYLFYAVIKKCQSSIFITYKTTFFNETNKNLCFG